MIALILFWVTKADLAGGFHPTITELLTFGALISATDPVSTLAVFQSKRVDPQLFYLVFGESVMNDAVGLVLFNAFAKFVQRQNDAGKIVLGVVEFLIFFTVDFVGSLCLGVLSGVLAALLLKVVDMRQTKLLELSLYIMIMYVPFLLAEMIHLSGIVTILFTGIAARRYCVPNLSEQTEENADVFFRLAAHLAETSIFLELGLSVAGLSGHGIFYGKFILWAFLACLVGRALNVYPITIFYNLSLRRPDFLSQYHHHHVPLGDVEMTENGDKAEEDNEAVGDLNGVSSMTLKSRRDQKIQPKVATMLWFAGLRGAVAYACAKSFPDTFHHQQEFMVATMVIVLLTVFLLGSTTELVLNALHIEVDVDEGEYMENITQDDPLTGLVHRLGTCTGSYDIRCGQIFLTSLPLSYWQKQCIFTLA